MRASLAISGGPAAIARAILASLVSFPSFFCALAVPHTTGHMANRLAIRIRFIKGSRSRRSSPAATASHIYWHAEKSQLATCDPGKLRGNLELLDRSLDGYVFV